MSLIKSNTILHGDALEVLKTLPDNCIDMILTSPPYDGLRTYNGFKFYFFSIAKELYRVLKNNCTMVWITSDQTTNGSESGNSFRQALYFQTCGFKRHDTMIYRQIGTSFPNIESRKRYMHSFEFMFIMVKGKITKFHGIKDRMNKNSGKYKLSHVRLKDNITFTGGYKEKAFGLRTNIWSYHNGYPKTSTDDIAYEHPAIFPEKLAQDHIISWSDPNDLILDPFLGSGTTAKMCLLNNRKYLGIEINKDYVQLANKRLKPYQNLPKS